MRMAAAVGHLALPSPMIAIVAHVLGIVLSIFVRALGDLAPLSELVLRGSVLDLQALGAVTARRRRRHRGTPESRHDHLLFRRLIFF